MRAVKYLLFAALLGLVALLGVACASKDPDQTSMPWSRPADWEGRLPGMGS